MRIAFIGQKGIPTRSGGVERHVEEVSTRMVREGHDVVVYARKSYGSKVTSFQGVRIILIPSIATKNLDAITYTFLATIHALFGKYDIIHYHGIGPASLSWIARLFGQSVVVNTFHSKDYEHQKWGRFARFYFMISEWITCRVPHATIVVGNVLKQYVLKRYDVKTTYIPNGASVQHTEQSNLIGQYGLEKGKYILSVSRLVKHKGIHFLIDAFKSLEEQQKIPNGYKLVIVGSHSVTETGEYEDSLRRQSNESKSILFLGEQTGETLRQLFSNAAFFVQPSLTEGLSIALLEAMGYGLMALVSDIPENMEVVGSLGMTFRCANIADLEKKLAYALDHPVEVSDRGLRSRQWIEKEYSWDSVTEKTLRLYQNTSQRYSAQSRASHAHSHM